MLKHRQQSGFTLVELLIVIVVIAVLATISIVAYTGIQERARDAQRMSDLRAMRQGIEMYLLEHGSLPATNPNPGNPSSLGRVWAISTDPDFLSALDPYLGEARFAPPGEQEVFVNMYAYHYYAAGTFGCDASLGPYAILRISGMETQDSDVEVDACPGNDQHGGPHDYAIWLYED